MSKDAWQKIHQPHELNWWARSGWAADKAGKRIRLTEEYKQLPIVGDTGRFSGKVLIDVGAGPRSFCEFLPVCEIIVVEPLADEFRKLNGGAYDVSPTGRVYCTPAEERIDGLVAVADFVWCFNTLNHCYDPLAVMENMAAYLNPDGELLLRVRLDESPHIGHPGMEGAAFYQKLAALPLSVLYNEDASSCDFLPKGRRDIRAVKMEGA